MGVFSHEIAPPPLPPRRSTPVQPKLPVESKSPRNQGPASPDEGGALSCPNCFCLNSAGAKTCLFCNKPLPLKPPKEPEIPSMSPQQQEFTGPRNFPVRALSPDQGTAGQTQQSQGSGSVVSGTRPTTSSSNAGVYFSRNNFIKLISWGDKSYSAFNMTS